MKLSKKFIIFITGASGVGKTTLVNNLKKKHSLANEWQFEHFDSIGVPSTEEMIENYGSGEAWQKAMTDQWVGRLITKDTDKQLCILEGQVNLTFIKDSFQKHHCDSYAILLVDTDEETMTKRLIEQRNQPELVNEDMKNWLGLLRHQAQELDVPIINTANKSEIEVASEFEQILSKLLDSSGSSII